MILTLPVQMDDGTYSIFPAYRVQHSSVLGPTKGGVRYDLAVDLGECAALAMWMTWKCALLRLPYGGAKGGVRCDARNLSQGELSRITRRFTAELAPFIGPELDIPAPDMATNEQTMAWMMDTYSMQKGYAVPEIVTGKPVSIGGSLFRHEATGAGVVMCVERACERLGWNLAEQRCVVQGFGNVGGIASTELHDRGARVIAVVGHLGGRARAGRARHPDAARVRRRARLARGLREWRRADHERDAARARVRHPRARRARGPGDGRECRQPALQARRGGRERTDVERGRPRSSPSAASRCCRTSSRTPAGSPSRTSSGSRTSDGSSGTATRSAAGSRTRCRTRSTGSGTSRRSGASCSAMPRSSQRIHEVSAALEARGVYP